jgi:beta-lactamase regulating signal transducer with metallopeptidase domain
MSLTGAFVIAAVMLARLLLKKAPKVISYALWAVAGFRLMFPFTPEAAFSLLPFNSTPIPHDIAMQAAPRIDSGITVLDNAVSTALPAVTPAGSTNPLQTGLAAGCCIWIFGMAIMLIYSIVSITLLHRRLRGAINVGDNSYEAVGLKTPFVMGLFRPKIYIPAGLSGEERRYIVLHEQTHIRRHDHIVKMLAYFVLCLHWFNPLAWAAFILMGADMEMSCDERVIKELGGDIKNAYSLSLVRVASERKILNGSPLAFGEGGMKERVKNVLNFKKHSRIVIIAAVILVTVLSVGFAANRTGDAQSQLQKITGATQEQAKQIELRLADCGVSYQTLAYSSNPITAGMHTDWQAYDLLTEDGSSYVLILRKSDNDFTAVLDNDGRLISGMIDNGVTPALYSNGEYKFKAWADAGENDEDVYDFSVPYIGDDSEADDSPQGPPNYAVPIEDFFSKRGRYMAREFTRGDLEFTVTNVIDSHWEVYKDDGGADVELLIIDYLPDAQLYISEPDMSDPQYTEDGLPHAQWGLGYGVTGEDNIRITDDINTVSITFDLRGIYHLESSLYAVRFVPYDTEP